MEKIMKNVIITGCLRLRPLELSDAGVLTCAIVISICHGGWQSCLYPMASKTRVALLQRRQRSETFRPLFF